MSGYPRFASFRRKVGPPPYQWTELGAVFLKTESERQFLLSEGYEFPNWEADGERSAALLERANPLDGTRLWDNS